MSLVSPILTIKGESRQRLIEAGTTRAFRGLTLDAKKFDLLLELSRNQITVKNMNRRITVSALMYVEDDETFGSNERVLRQQRNSAILSFQGGAQTVMVFEVRMGGEIRVEFRVDVSLVDSNGNAVVDCELKLYEGTSESTDDLDGVRQFQLYVPVGAIVNHFVRVNNDDEGGDYATVLLNIINAPA